MKNRKSIIETVYNILVVDGAERTPTQLAKAAKTTEHSVRSAISRIRAQCGEAIYANVKTDRKGVEKVVYRVGTPTKYMTKTGSTLTR